MQHRNTFMGGMKSGMDFTLFPQDSYKYMLNGYLISKDEHGLVVTDIKGTVSFAQFEVNEVPIGYSVFQDKLYIIAHDGTADVIRIYCIDGSNGTAWQQGQMLPLLNGPLDINNNQTVF